MAKETKGAAPAEETQSPPVEDVAGKAAQGVETPQKETKETKGAKGSNPITVKYRDHRGEPTERTFSKEVHGEKFAALAEEFKQSNAARIIKED